MNQAEAPTVTEGVQFRVPYNPDLGLMIDSYSRVTAEAAVGAYLFVRDRQSFFDVVREKKEVDAFKNDIDGAANIPFEHRLNNIPYRTISVGSEGDKEEEKTGYAAPSAKGVYGPHLAPVKFKISDVVEGTTATSQLKPGGSSALVISRENGLRPVEKGKKYIMRLSGPPELNDVLDLSLGIAENLDRAADKLRMPKSSIRLVMLKGTESRRENIPIVEEAKRTGARIEDIDAGDMLPGILSVLPLDSHGQGVVISGGGGRSGIEETAHVGGAAKITGGFLEVKEYSTDPIVLAANEIHTLDYVVPGEPHETLVSITPITEDVWLEIPAIKEDGKTLTTTTWVLSSRGVNHMVQEHRL